MTTDNDQPNVGRNDPCPCGSGKKYKKCCAMVDLLPGASENEGQWEQFWSNVRSHIREVGQSVVSVSSDGTFPAFGYTIGNRERSLPDLLVMGTGIHTQRSLLRDFAKLQVERGLTNGEVFGSEEFGFDGHKLKTVYASNEAKEKCTVQTGEFYGDECDYDLVQVIISDSKGCFPDELDCDPKAIVPIFAVEPGDE